MKDFAPASILAILQELAGGLLWPSGILAAAIALLLVVGLFRQGGFRGAPARQAFWIGLVGGLLAIAAAPFLTQAKFSNVHGLLDWIALVLIGLAAFVIAAVAAFALRAAFRPPVRPSLRH